MTKKQEIMTGPQYGFITEKDVPELIAENPNYEVLLRCGSNRFVCKITELKNQIEKVYASGDYLRDVSFPVKM